MLRRLLTGILLTLSIAAPALAQDNPAGSYADFVPGADGDIFSTVGDTPPEEGLVIRIFELSFAEACNWSLTGAPDMRKPEVFERTFRYEFDEADAPDHPIKIYRFFCSAGAYNEQHVYMTWDPDNGLQAQSFATPTYAYDLTDPNNPDAPIRAIRITGFDTRQSLTNSSFDPDLGRITSRTCYRGVCDASSLGTWVLSGPDFQLESFAVDPSYDGEVNLVPLVDYTTPTEVPLTFLDSEAVENATTIAN
jgi:hypothetical protein